MKKLIDYIKEAQSGKYSLGHFNVSDLATFKGIVEGFEEMRRLSQKDLAVIIGVSEGERAAVGLKQIVALVQSYKDAGLPIFLNADHTKSLEKAKEAAEAGFDAVLFDAGQKPFEEDLEETKEAVAAVKAINSEIIIEGELGFLGEGSKVRMEVPEGVSLSPQSLTSPEEARRFFEEAGVDLIAPAVGNIHGVIRDKAGVFQNPEIDIGRIAAIAKSVTAPLVLHGGSGIKDEELKNAVAAGMAVTHISTELRLVWREELEASLMANPEEIAPYKLLQPSKEAVKNLVFQKLKLLNSVLY
jgi:fructose-bisphosphate aldolase class II